MNNKSLLVSNMRQEASQMDEFSVLIGTEVAHFHSVRGEYDKMRDMDVVKLVHEVQGHGSPFRTDTEQLSNNVEAHLCDNYYNLNVSSFDVIDEYPDRDYCLELRVDSYQQGPYSFSEALSANADNRETRYEH